ncbi:MAG: hypothetical protein OXC30_04570 [Alphaproteobacteria bacterium]|nr:hypothetical protein [Alphaproteobacteria bacterium]
MLDLRRFSFIFLLQGAAIGLMHISTIAKKTLDFTITNSSVLTLMSIIATGALSIILFLLFCYLANRWSVARSIGVLSSLMLFGLLALGLFIIPHWKYSAHDILLASSSCSSWSDYVKIAIVSSPFIKMHALLNVFGIFMLTFSFWQTSNSYLTPAQARVYYPALTVSFAFWIYIIQKAVSLWGEHCNGPTDMDLCHITQLAQYTLALAPIFIIFTLLLRSNSSKEDHLSLPAFEILKSCLCDHTLRRFTILNIAGMAAVGLFASHSIDVISTARYMGETTTSWTQYNPLWTTIVLILAAIVSFAILKKQGPFSLLRIFGLLFIVIGTLSALFLPSTHTLAGTLFIYIGSSIKYCKHSLFMMPKQLIYLSWKPEYQIKAKAFYDLMLDRLSFILGSILYILLKSLHIVTEVKFYPLFGITLALLGLITFVKARTN